MRLELRRDPGRLGINDAFLGPFIFMVALNIVLNIALHIVLHIVLEVLFVVIL